jgi:predicted nuclease of restriction endonuclease-like (RecB) superfamily
MPFEAADKNWNTRLLDKQVDKRYYERLISTHKETINELNADHLKQLIVNPHDYILKDPLVLEFYDNLRL